MVRLAETVFRPSAGDDLPALMMVGQKGKKMSKKTKANAIRWEGGRFGLKQYFDYAGFRFCIDEISLSNEKTLYYLARYNYLTHLNLSFEISAHGEGREFFKRWYKMRFGHECNPCNFFGTFDDWSYRGNAEIEYRGKELFGFCFLSTLDHGSRCGGFFNSISEVKCHAEKWLNLTFGKLVEEGTSKAPIPIINE